MIGDINRTPQATLPPRWHPSAARGWSQRLLFEGELVLDEATHLGGGDLDPLVDLPLLTDADTGQPLLLGSTLAGALRAYLERAQVDRAWIEALFGSDRGEETLRESPLIVRDALGDAGTPVEIREGVRLDQRSRTSAQGALYDLETWAAGTRFPLRLELRLEPGAAPQIRSALATALHALTKGHLAFGTRKRRGYGAARVPSWRFHQYDLTQPASLLHWLRQGAEPLPASATITSWPDALGVPLLPDRRQYAALEASFRLSSSLLIRTGGLGPQDPDLVYLQARQADGKPHPILSGSSLAGALRAHATRIVNTIQPPSEKGRTLIEALFGPDLNREATIARASRLHTRTAVIRAGQTDLVQHRVSIDRFTGGAFPGALFSEQPVFGTAETHLTIRVVIEKPDDHELGLLLLLLKDLSTGLLPLGGEQSVGRGCLDGRSASLHLYRGENTQTWHFGGAAPAENLSPTEAATLQAYVDALCHHLS